jgi:thiamine-phosphate pyrophosphorylase
VHELVSIPIFCIGGINLETLDAVIAAGARRVVIVSALLRAGDLVEYAREVRSRLDGMDGS